MDFSVDAGLMIAIGCFFISSFYYFNDHPSYTMYNLGISCIASTLNMIMSLAGLHAMVKGLAGPTSAIIYT
jgi:hypothetical protein